MITVTVTSESESPCGPDGARRPRRFFEHSATGQPLAAACLSESGWQPLRMYERHAAAPMAQYSQLLRLSLTRSPPGAGGQGAWRTDAK